MSTNLGTCNGKEIGEAIEDKKLSKHVENTNPTLSNNKVVFSIFLTVLKWGYITNVINSVKKKWQKMV